MRFFFKWQFYFLLITALMLGCSSKPADFYVLNVMANKKAGKSYKGMKIGIRTLQIPEYLQRPQLVYRLTKNQLELDEFKRWAEPLKNNISRVLSNDMMHLLPGALVRVYPWSYLYKPQYKLFIEVTDFDTTDDGVSRLIAHYEIYQGSKLSATRKVAFYKKLDTVNIDNIIRGMNINLHRLSQSIVSTVERL